MKYRVFHRKWWKRNPAWPNGLEPNAGRKTTICYVDTEEAARDVCRVWCANNAPGKYSDKAEYEQVQS